MPDRRPARSRALIQTIVGEQMHRHTTAAVLFHHALAGRLGLGPTDLKCLDLLRERGPMTSSEVATLTGLTTGAMVSVVERLERGGYVRREADAKDRRKQILRPRAERAAHAAGAFAPIHRDLASVFAGFDAKELAAIAAFLDQSTALIYRHAAVLRAEVGLAIMPAASSHEQRARRHR